MLVATDRGRINRDVPVESTGGIDLGLHLLKQPFPGSDGRPAPVALVEGLAWPVAFRQVPPLHPGPHPVQDAVDHVTVVGGEQMPDAVRAGVGRMAGARRQGLHLDGVSQRGERCLMRHWLRSGTTWSVVSSRQRMRAGSGKSRDCRSASPAQRTRSKSWSPAHGGRHFQASRMSRRPGPVGRVFDQYGDEIMALILLLAAPLVIGMLTAVVWLLGRRAKVPSWMLIVFLLAGWLTVSVGWALSQRAQPSLFPETSPCYGTRDTPVSQYFPPDSFCRHADGELRTVNGANSKLMFWSAANTTLAVVIAAAFVRRRQRS